MAAGLPDPQDKAAVVRAMFDRIAPRYDAMNRLMTGALDRRWRRLAIEAAGVGPGRVVVDLACGTGDLAELAARAGARAIGLDFAPGMLAAARRRGVPASFVRADAAHLPVGAASADALVCGFALRNFDAIPPVLGEAARVVRPGGRIALLEVDTPRVAPLRWGHRVWFHHVVPLVGGALSDRAAYRYLPQSVAYLPPEAELSRMIEAAGFCDLRKRRLLGGAAQILSAVRA